MSLPEQEARALDDVLQFVLDISSGAEKRIPTATRQRARRVARHYPLAAGAQWLDLHRAHRVHGCDGCCS